MLRSVRIIDFKSYRDAKLRLAPLTFLIGANASGKSNAIEALRFLSWFAQGNPLSRIRYNVQEDNELIRGSINDITRRGSRSFSFDCFLPYKNHNRFKLTCTLRESDELHITDERIESKISAVPLYEVVEPSQGTSNDAIVAYNNFARGGKKPRVTCNDQFAILQQLQSSARFSETHKAAQRTVPDVCGTYAGWLSSIFFLDPQPHLMRGYAFTNEYELHGSGENISGVAFNLCEDGRKDELLSFIQDVPEQAISDISFIDTPRGEVMIRLLEGFGNSDHWCDAPLLSDGTLRILSIASMLLTAEQDTTVVIEEIDNGVHPSRASSLLENIYRVAEERGIRVLITSHNPALLDALPDTAIPHINFCYRDVEDGSSRIVRLQDLPTYPEIVAQGQVGSLMTRGVLDRYAKSKQLHAYSSDDRSNWLVRLREQVG